MADWVHRNIIVPASVVGQARAICASFPSGGGMFITPLSASGELPATHYISSGLIWPEFAAMLPLDVPATETEPEHRIPGDANAAAQALPELPVEAINALLAAIVVTDDDPFATLNRQQLKIITEQAQ